MRFPAQIFQDRYTEQLMQADLNKLRLPDPPGQDEVTVWVVLSKRCSRTRRSCACGLTETLRRCFVNEFASSWSKKTVWSDDVDACSWNGPSEGYRSLSNIFHSKTTKNVLTVVIELVGYSVLRRQSMPSVRRYPWDIRTWGLSRFYCWTWIGQSWSLICSIQERHATCTGRFWRTSRIACLSSAPIAWIPLYL